MTCPFCGNYHPLNPIGQDGKEMQVWCVSKAAEGGDVE